MNRMKFSIKVAFLSLVLSFVITMTVFVVGKEYFFLVMEFNSLAKFFMVIVTTLYGFTFFFDSTGVPSKKKVYGRYRKSGDFVLEDLVVLLRCSVSFNLGKRQVHSASQLLKWQHSYEKRGAGFPKKLRHLTPDNVKLDEEFLLSIVKAQHPDHLRIFAKSVKGVMVFGAYQGLQDSSRYEFLFEVPESSRFLTHMSKKDTTQQIYKRETIKVTRKVRRAIGPLPSEPGFLCGMGRHLHTLGHCVLTSGGHVAASQELRDKVKHKVTDHATNRDKYQAAIGIDLHKVYRHYPRLSKTQVAGINELGTVLVFVDVPPDCLIWGKNGPIDAGTFWKG